MGTLAYFINDRAIGCDGDRQATYPVLAIKICGMVGLARATIVSGPGKKDDVRIDRACFSISRRFFVCCSSELLPLLVASSSFELEEASHNFNASSQSQTCTISGSLNGRSFASNTFCTATGSNA